MYNETNRSRFLSQRKVKFLSFPNFKQKRTKNNNYKPSTTLPSDKNSSQVEKHFNQVEKEIIKLMDKESDVIHYIDDTSFSSMPTKKITTTELEKITTEMNIIQKSKSPNKSVKKKKSYLDYNDDEISLDKFLEVNDSKHKIPNSYSNGFLQVKPKKKGKI